MIRAAAKNHAGVAVVVKPEAYDAVLEELREFGGEISTETRHWLANEAFAHTASYDAAISRWFGSRYENFPDHWVMPHEKFIELSYGENPHQRAAFYVEAGAGTARAGSSVASCTASRSRSTTSSTSTPPGGCSTSSPSPPA